MKAIRSIYRTILILAAAICVILYFAEGPIWGGSKNEMDGQPEESPAAMARAGFSHELVYKDIECPELGFSISVPENMTIDDSLASAFIRIKGSGMDIRLSREASPYDGIDSYIDTYLYKYMLDPDYRKANNITLMKNEYRDIGGIRTKLLAFTRKPAAGSIEKQQYYCHALFLTGGKEFYCCFIKYDRPAQQEEIIERITASFKKIGTKGEATNKTALRPELPDWNEEALAFYNSLRTSNTIKWGIFYPSSLTGDFSRIEEMEKQLDYKFPITLHYIYLGHKFPTEGMKRAYEWGKTVELTMQVMWNIAPGNTDDEHKNLNFDLLDGMYDDYLRKFAREAKAFGHPFIFRLNNEMNSTWVRYSGIALLCDPDVYIQVWRHIYDIFALEGVDNAIWVFNPNDIDYPPMNWNSHISYYPGNGYVQLIGLTGYNTGTYYIKLTQENWRSFKAIYGPLNEKFSKAYGEFPWMITEFACSSVGGDKEKWIREMFRDIRSYRNIKAAVWWSYADYDTSRGKPGIPARRYWLDEAPAYMKAFREGLNN